MPAARYFAIAITPDNSAVYYTRIEKSGPRIYRHHMGQDFAKDELVFGEQLGPEMLARGSLSEDGRYLLLEVSHGFGGAARDEVYYKDLVAGGPVRAVVNDLEAKFRASIGAQHHLSVDQLESSELAYSVCRSYPAASGCRPNQMAGGRPADEVRD